jgi:hypothetical protein
MMSRKSILLALVFFLFPVVVHAQTVVGINAGMALPFGNLSDAAGKGYSIATDVFYGFSDELPNLRIGARIAYNKFGSHNYRSYGSGASSSAYSFEMVPSLRFVLKRPNKPMGGFIQFGAGLYATSIKFTDVPSARDQNTAHFGASIGGGITYRMAPHIHVVFSPLYNVTEKNYLSFNFGFLFGSSERPEIN